jgi:ABC-2 type transport system permease protein
VRAFPTLFRVGVAEAVAYRAEFIVWMLTTTMPLVNLALWSAVAREAPGGQFKQWGQADFVAYFLAMLIVRTLTGSWVVWQLNQEIRTGTLSMRLLRPVHPFVAYGAEHLAAVPLRSAMALPVMIVMLVSVGGGHVVRDPLLLWLLPVSLAATWLMTFASMLMIGSLGLFIERSTAVFEMWLAILFVLGGYLAPIALLPAWLQRVVHWLPSYYMLAAPVEWMIGRSTREVALRHLAIQWAWVAIFAVLAQLVWRRGIRRFEAYGS